MKTDKSDKPSRLARHMSLLDLTDEKLSAAETEEERAFVDSMNPKPLHFPEENPARSYRKSWLAVPFVLGAAALALLFIKPREETGWTVKGAAKIDIFVEREGEVRPFTTGDEVSAGERIKAEVFAVRPSVAFWGVSSRDGRLLSDAPWIWDNRINLDSQERKSFAGSLQLDERSEGESLCVVECPSELLGQLDAQVFSQSIADVIRSKSLPQGDLRDCRSQCSELRK